MIAHGLFHWAEYRHASAVPGPIRKTLKEIAERGIGDQPTVHVLDAQMHKLFSKYYQHNLDTLKVLADYSANLLFATDTTIGQSFANAPGFSEYLDMQAWQKAGVSLSQIFKAATLSNAKAFHLEDSIGTVEVGKKANLLLLQANPLATVSAYDRIELVIINGTPVTRQHLAADQNVLP